MYVLTKERTRSQQEHVPDGLTCNIYDEAIL